MKINLLDVIFNSILSVNITLKLLNYIDWSWWLVFYPLYIKLILFVIIELIKEYKE